MIVKQRVIESLAIFSYLIGDEKTKECVVVDPARDIDAYITLAKQIDYTITHVIETHVHADYLSGGKAFKERFHDAVTIHSSQEGGEKWTAKYADHQVKSGNSFNVGDLTFKAFHTPGHTPEHLIWAVYEKEEEDPRLLLTGDLLFAGSVGRPDLLGEKEVEALADRLYESLFITLKQFPDQTDVAPGHGAGSLCGKAIQHKAGTTLGIERKTNPLMQQIDKEVWKKKLMEGAMPIPDYFLRMKELNVVGPPKVDPAEKWLKTLTPDDFLNDPEALIIDTRPAEEYVKGFIQGSLNIPFNSAFLTRVGTFVSPEKKLCLLTNDPESVAHELSLIGYDFIKGVIPFKVAEPFEVEEIPSLSLKEVYALSPKPTVVDVRSESEWNEGHLDDAIHKPLEKIESLALSHDEPVALICRSGGRSALAASLLKRRGFHSVFNINGGMSANQATGAPEKKCSS